MGDYSDWEVAWYVGGFLAWVPAYTVIIYRLVRRRQLEIPAVAAIGNITWEFVWGFLYHPDMGDGLQLVYQGAFFIDCFILAGVFAFGAKQTDVAAVRRWFPACVAGMIAAWVAFYVSFVESGYDLPLGSVSAYLVNLAESALYLWAGLSRADHASLSRTVAWSKGIGTGMVSVFVFMRYPDNDFVRTLAVLVGTLDLAYIVLLERRHRSTKRATSTAVPARAALVRGRWTDAVLDPMRLVGDPVADEPVRAVLEAGEADAVNALLRTLVRVDQPDPRDLPPEIRTYLDTTLDLPDWADREQIAHAERLFQVFGPQIVTCLFCASLPSAYAAASGVQALALTARLETDARRRIMETGQFLVDVLAPGGLGPDGHGRRAIQRVRLMHAAVRHLIEARAEQDPSIWNPAWGLPINQEELAGTMLSFSYVVAEPLPRLGIDVGRSEAEAYLHTWNVIGSMIGVRDELLVHDLDDAAALVTSIRERTFAPSPEGKAMTAALLELLDELSPLRALDRFFPTLVRHLVGEETAGYIGVPEGARLRWRFAGELAHLASFIENEVAHHDILQRIIEPVSRELLAAGFALERGGERVPFAIPQALADAWRPGVIDLRTPAPSSPIA